MRKLVDYSTETALAKEDAMLHNDHGFGACSLYGHWPETIKYSKRQSQTLKLASFFIIEH